MKKQQYLTPEAEVAWTFIGDSVILSSPTENGNGENLGQESVGWGGWTTN